MYKELNVKVGDTVFYHRRTWGNVLPEITKVVKITPTGRIKIESCPGMQFDKYGNAMGRDTWPRGYLEVPTAEKVREVKEKYFIRKLIHYLHDEVHESDISYEQAVAIDGILKAGEADET